MDQHTSDYNGSFSLALGQTGSGSGGAGSAFGYSAGSGSGSVYGGAGSSSSSGLWDQQGADIAGIIEELLSLRPSASGSLVSPWTSASGRG